MNFHNDAQLQAYKIVKLKDATTINERKDILAKFWEGPSDLTEFILHSELHPSLLQFQILSYYRNAIIHQTSKDVKNWNKLVIKDHTSCFHGFDWFKFAMSIQGVIYEPSLDLVQFFESLKLKFKESKLVIDCVRSVNYCMFKDLKKKIEPKVPNEIMRQMKDFVIIKPVRFNPTEIMLVCKILSSFVHSQSQATLTNNKVMRYWNQLLDTTDEEDHLEQFLKGESNLITKIQEVLDSDDMDDESIQRDKIMDLIEAQLPCQNHLKLHMKFLKLVNTITDIFNSTICTEKPLLVTVIDFPLKFAEDPFWFETENNLNDDIVIDNGDECIVIKVKSTPLLKDMFYRLYDNPNPDRQLIENKVMLSYIKELVSSLAEKGSNFGVITNYYYSLFLRFSNVDEALTIENPTNDKYNTESPSDHNSPIKILGKEVEFLEIDHNTTGQNLRWMIFYGLCQLSQTQKGISNLKTDLVPVSTTSSPSPSSASSSSSSSPESEAQENEVIDSSDDNKEEENDTDMEIDDSEEEKEETEEEEEGEEEEDDDEFNSGLESLFYKFEDFCDLTIPKMNKTIRSHYISGQEEIVKVTTREFLHLVKNSYPLLQKRGKIGDVDKYDCKGSFKIELKLIDEETKLQFNLETEDEFIYVKYFIQPFRQDHIEKDTNARKKSFVRYCNEMQFLKFCENYNRGRPEDEKLLLRAPKLYDGSFIEGLNDGDKCIYFGYIIFEEFINGKRKPLERLTKPEYNSLKVQNGILRSLNIDHRIEYDFKEYINLVEKKTDQVYLVDWEYGSFADDESINEPNQETELQRMEDDVDMSEISSDVSSLSSLNSI